MVELIVKDSHNKVTITFYTVLVKIAGVLNSRPLTYLGEDDVKEPLTPIPLYCDHRIINPIEGEGCESDPDFGNNCEQAI